MAIQRTPTSKDRRQELSEGLRIASTRNALLVESKHQRIVEGACRVFFKKGYHPTTIREIAKACGMSMGELYHKIEPRSPSHHKICRIGHERRSDPYHEGLMRG